MVGLGGDYSVNAELYVQQMERLEMTVQEKRPNRQLNVLLMHDNARPHFANMTKEAIQNRAGRCCHICHTHLIWHQQIFTFFDHFQMLCVGFRLTVMQN